MAIPTKKGPDVGARPFALPAQRTPRHGGWAMVGEGFQSLGVGLQRLGGGVGNVEEQVGKLEAEEKRKADDARVNDAVSEATSNITTRTVGDAQHESARQAAEAAWAEPDDTVRRGDYVDQPLTEDDILSAGGGTSSAAEGGAVTGARSGGGSMPAPAPVDDQVAELYARREQPGGVRGFLATKGLSASQLSAEALETIDRDRVRIRKGLANDEQRAIFDARTAGMYAATRQRVELHVQEQNEATVRATSQALQESGLTAVAADPGNEELALAASAGVVADIRKNAPSPIVADYQVKQWNSRVAEVRVRQFMAANDWKNAKKVLDGSKGNLSPGVAEKFNGLVDQMETEQKGDVIAAQAISASMLPNGKVDAEKAMQYIDDVTGSGLDLTTGDTFPIDEKLRKGAKARLTPRLTTAAKQWKDDTAALEQQVGAVYAAKGWFGIPVEMRESLRVRDYEAYLRLRDYERLKFDRANRGDDADARREQAETDKQVMNDFLARPVEERADLNVDTEYVTSGVSPVGLSAIKVKQRAAKDTVTKGHAVKENDFVSDSMASGQGIATTKAAKDELKASAREAFTDFVQKNGRVPDLAEAEKMKGELLGKSLTKPGLIYGFNEEYGYQKRGRDRKSGAKSGGVKVEVIDAKGNRKAVPEGSLDAWLKVNPGWKRRDGR